MVATIATHKCFRINNRFVVAEEDLRWDVALFIYVQLSQDVASSVEVCIHKIYTAIKDPESFLEKISKIVAKHGLDAFNKITKIIEESGMNDWFKRFDASVNEKEVQLSILI